MLRRAGRWEVCLDSRVWEQVVSCRVESNSFPSYKRIVLIECTRGACMSPSHERSTPHRATGAAVPGPLRLRAEGLSGASAPGSPPPDVNYSGTAPRSGISTVASNSLARPLSEDGPPPVDGIPGSPLQAPLLLIPHLLAPNLLAPPLLVPPVLVHAVLDPPLLSAKLAASRLWPLVPLPATSLSTPCLYGLCATTWLF